MGVPATTVVGRAGDDELVRQVIEGSEAALASLYDRHATTIFRLALRVNGDRTTAEEVVQETFLTLWDRAELFDETRGSFATWLATIARHRAVDRWRMAARRLNALPFSALTGDSPDDSPPIDLLVASGDAVAAGAPPPAPDAVVAAGESVVEIASALAVLAPEERQAILLAYRDGLSQSEIAAHLGWPLGTVKTRSRRALRRLRDAIGTPQASIPVSTDLAVRTALPAPGAVDRGTACC